METSKTKMNLPSTDSVKSSIAFSKFLFKPKSKAVQIDAPIHCASAQPETYFSKQPHQPVSDKNNLVEDNTTLEDSLNFDLMFDEIDSKDFDFVSVDCKSAPQNLGEKNCINGDNCKESKTIVDDFDSFNDDDAVFNATFREEEFDSLCKASDQQSDVASNSAIKKIESEKGKCNMEFNDVVFSDDDEEFISLCELSEKCEADNNNRQLLNSSDIHQPSVDNSHNENQAPCFNSEIAIETFLLGDVAASTPFSKRTSDCFDNNDRVKRSCLESPSVTCNSKNRHSWSDPRARKRKFPGPAGLLADLPLEQNRLLFESDLSATASKLIYDQEFLCSQSCSEDFQRPSWQNMLKFITTKNNKQLMQEFNIKTMLQKAKKKCLPKHVVAKVLCVMLEKFDEKSYSATFKDETGEIEGKIDSKICQLHLDFLLPYSVLVLKQVTILFNILIVKEENLVSLFDCNGKSIVFDDIVDRCEVAINSAAITPHGSKFSSALVNIPQIENEIVDPENLFEDDFDDLLPHIT